jgi:hypothetical protein
MARRGLGTVNPFWVSRGTVPRPGTGTMRRFPALKRTYTNWGVCVRGQGVRHDHSDPPTEAVTLPSSHTAPPSMRLRLLRFGVGQGRATKCYMGHRAAFREYPVMG